MGEAVSFLSRWSKVIEGQRVSFPKDHFWRHKKRGTIYERVGQAQVQCPKDAPLTDYEVVEVYRDVNDGELWVRRVSEFHDGRYEPASPTPLPNDATEEEG